MMVEGEKRKWKKKENMKRQFLDRWKDKDSTIGVYCSCIIIIRYILLCQVRYHMR